MLLFRVGFLDIGWLDLLDIGLVALLIYQIYALVRGSVASRVFVGYLLTYFVYLIVKALGLELLSNLLGGFISVGALALIVIFQQEIRRFLLLIGRSTNAINNQYLRRLLLRQTPPDEPRTPLQPILAACKTLSDEQSGGLIVLARNDEVDKVTATGEAIDAVVSRPLLLALFCRQSPLHDGAIVIANGRVLAARCILPVSDDESLPPALGFRHRAAVGMSEASDAAVIVISEETGRLSLAINGQLSVGIDAATLETRLAGYLGIA
jgi:diadenylate cyclase